MAVRLDWNPDAESSDPCHGLFFLISVPNQRIKIHSLLIKPKSLHIKRLKY